MADTMADYGSLDFAEQIAFFKEKLDLPTQRWDDLLGAAHDRAFVVAGATGADLLADLHAAVLKGIEEGATLETFRRDFDRIVKARGWVGWTGSDTPEGVAWRTRVIYETNLRTSYAAGRWQQIQAVKADRPYLEYRHSESVLHPRPLHQSWDGLILPADDPWWQTHYPPNGWGCKCRVFTLSAADLKKMGRSGPDRAPDDGTYQVTDKRTKEVHTLPRGIDRGWNYAPGATWHPDLDRYPYEVARDLVAGTMTDGVFDRWIARINAAVDARLATPEYAGLTKEQTAARLRQDLARGEAYPVAALTAERQAQLQVQTRTVLFSDYDAIKQANSRRGDPQFTVDAYRDVQHVLDDPQLVVRESDQMTVWFRRDGRLMVAVIQQTRTGRGLFLKSLRLGSSADARRATKKGQVILERPE